MNSVTRQKFTTVALLLLLSVPFFWFLGDQAILIWDESRAVGHAWEMYAHGNWWILHFDGDDAFFWNTRPPVMMWLQAGLAKWIGFNEWSIRLPSAIAAWATMLLVFLWVRQATNNIWLGLFAASAMVGSNGYMAYHTARNGDLDSLLVWFTILASFSLYRATEGRQLLGRWLALACVWLALAVLTKSVAGLLMVPGMAIWVVYRKHFGALWHSRWWYVGLATFLLMVGSYYGYREWLSPGYLNAVWEVQLGGRYLSTIEGHKHPAYYYIIRLATSQFIGYWLLLIPLMVWPGYLSRDHGVHLLVRFAAFMSLSYLAIISLGSTKLPWYTMPSIPFLAILAASGGWVLLQRFNWQKPVVAGLALFAILHLGMRYYSTWNPERFHHNNAFYGPSYWLKHKMREGRGVHDYFIWYDGYKAHLQAYQWYAADRGQAVRFTDQYGLAPGRKVMVVQEENRAYVEANYNVELLDEGPGFRVYLIVAMR
jgi:4-amino-4-deoxy-L-arabinose transferase-like glycosyltransferase